MNKNVEFAEPMKEGRFRFDKDYNIIDVENEISPIVVDMTPTSDGSESATADRLSVLYLLNRLDDASKNKRVNGSVMDAVYFLEENIILLEKIMKDIDYIGRANFKESQQFSKQREERYLFAIQNRYEKLFDECWVLIRQMKEGLKD